MDYDKLWVWLQREILFRAETTSKCTGGPVMATGFLGFKVTVIAQGSRKIVHLVRRKSASGENDGEHLILRSGRLASKGSWLEPEKTSDDTSWAVQFNQEYLFTSDTGETFTATEFCNRIFEIVCES